MNSDVSLRTPRELADDRLAYEKQPWESIKAWEAFVTYRDLGFERTLAKTARYLKKGEGMIAEWSARNCWKLRCEAYDMMIDRRMREQRESAMDVMLNAHGEAAGAMLDVATKLLLGDPDAGTSPLPPSALDPKDVPTYLRTAVEIQRLSAGLATSHVKGALAITPADFNRVINGIVALALRHIPAESQETFLRGVQELSE